MPTISPQLQSLRDLNFTYLLLARELAQQSVPEAAVSTGMSTTALTALVNAPLTTVEALAKTPACLFMLRVPDITLRSFVDTHSGDTPSFFGDIAKLRLIGSLVPAHQPAKKTRKGKHPSMV